MTRSDKNPGHDTPALLAAVGRGHVMSSDEARCVFDDLMDGRLNRDQIKGLLESLRTRGEATEELIGAAMAMRARVLPIKCSRDCIDTCGTGGDGLSTFNVSTTAAVIAAAAGAVVAKHGNRSTTRASGSTEVLGELGIDVEADPTRVQQCLEKAGIAYLNARLLHPAMRYAAPVRQAMSGRTIFNLLGPLTNPAGAKRQVLGVPHQDLVPKIASALQELDVTHAWVVHGDGLCDLTITGPTLVEEVKQGESRRFTVTPEDVGLARAPKERLLIDGPQSSARMVLSVLKGEAGPHRDHAVMNAAAALIVAGKADSLTDGIVLATDSIDSGRAAAKLAQWRACAPVS